MEQEDAAYISRYQDYQICSHWSPSDNVIQSIASVLHRKRTRLLEAVAYSFSLKILSIQNFLFYSHRFHQKHKVLFFRNHFVQQHLFNMKEKENSVEGCLHMKGYPML
jgi:hypothetical protein